MIVLTHPFAFSILEHDSFYPRVQRQQMGAEAIMTYVPGSGGCIGFSDSHLPASLPSVPLFSRTAPFSPTLGPQASGWTFDSRVCLTNDFFLPLSGKPRQDWGCHCSVSALQQHFGKVRGQLSFIPTSVRWAVMWGHPTPNCMVSTFLRQRGPGQMRGAGASRDRHSAPSSEARWKHLVTGRSIFSHVEDTHLIALGYSFSLGCLLLPSMIQEGVRKGSCIKIGPRGQSGSYLKPSGLSFSLGVWEN